ncbi:substrate-binding periplasmic protein [Pseudomonas panipatensis]|uniref:Polar amino acid transport system substrate-binding protein n=1 Tax=Pseudomonas panipatensis TaxID=428992 RepID=A0A1G8EE72_9PSED|nr:transporter substrate-binding domain-containing protein [Pseudomonas panipatensis]SDH68080.1 polar amino acid transport system substrate-binding protein [Pseudomonas panipatensis]SMP67616.1 amino acid ABC transporter substrate-binding protein, PAAT family [Pseudomonas panipatensis]
MHFPRTLRCYALPLLLGLGAAQADTLHVATLDWAPYVSPDLPGQGLAARILSEALALNGDRAELVFLPWQRALNETREGRYDALMPAYLSAERSQDFYTSMPLLDSQLGFFHRRDHAIAYQPGNLDSLRPYRIGVVRGYVNQAAFDQADFLQKDPVTNDWQNLEKLLRGRIDLAVADRYTGYHLLARNAPALREQLEFIEPPLEIKPLYVLVPKIHGNGQALAASLDRSLRTLRQSGRLQQLIADAHLEQAQAIRAIAEHPLAEQIERASQQQRAGEGADNRPAAPTLGWQASLR